MVMRNENAISSVCGNMCVFSFAIVFYLFPMWLWWSNGQDVGLTHLAVSLCVTILGKLSTHK